MSTAQKCLSTSGFIQSAAHIEFLHLISLIMYSLFPALGILNKGEKGTAFYLVFQDTNLESPETLLSLLSSA